jgi:endoglucanase
MSLRIAPVRRLRMPLARALAAAALWLALTGCASGPAARGDGSPAGIVVDQLGYLPGGAKWAAVRAASPPAKSFALRDDASGAVVLRGALTPPREWSAARQSWQLADFSAVRSPGRYRLQVDGQPASMPFVVDAQVYAGLNAAAIKAYYFNRAGIELKSEYAGPYARAAGHPDDHVLVHACAAGPGRPEGTVISSPKGWYDAGDYNKYIVNSAISVYTLLTAYEQFPGFFRRQDLRIPESGNGLPDLLDEVLWNLDWMSTMQDPADGGVYHKLTNKRFDAMVMPDRATTERYVVQKTTAATLDFAASMAMASRVVRAFESQRPGLSARMLQAAQRAWAWAVAHPGEVYRQPPDIATGEYGDGRLDDEFAWAAAELYISTRDDRYWALLARDGAPLAVPAWWDVRTLAWISLAQHRDELTPAADQALIERRVLELGDRLSAQWAASPFKLAMQDGDFIWGSNAVALNQAFVMLQAYRLSHRRPLLDAAQSALDYVLGRNPLGQSYVTGFGVRAPMHPHHRPSEADGVAAPVPGFMVAGPNPGQDDRRHCATPYPSALPALSYLDATCAYASNEVAINWNAPLVYVSTALHELTPKSGEGAP